MKIMQGSIKLKYELEQQTPMIHYQHNEKGVCVRASEMKPKLDKYLIKKLKLNYKYDEKRKEYHWNWKREDGTDLLVDDWFLKRGEKTDTALNYKMKIISIGKTVTLKPYSLYYGNMGCKQEDKVYMICGNFTLEITCFVESLRTIIAQEVSDFFKVYNFGRMQDKGFGSFIVKGTDTKNIRECLRIYYGAKKCYAMKYTKKSFDDFIQNERLNEKRKEQKNKRPISDENKKSNWSFEQYVFEDIKTVYSIMKSGRNFPYQRGIIFKYFYDKYTIRNEKKEMKIKNISPNIKKSTTTINLKECTQKDIKYVRAMLGVGDKIEYIQNLDDYNKPVKDENGKVVKERITISNSEIERMESPIFFKVIKEDNQYSVYIVARRVNEQIFDKDFIFKNDTTKKSIMIKTPESFDIDDFMEYFYNTIRGVKGIRGDLE